MINSCLNQRKDEIFKLIGNDNIRRALEVADELVKERGDSNLNNQFTLLKMRFTRTRNRVLKGEISRVEGDIEEGKLVSNFLELIEQLK